MIRRAREGVVPRRAGPRLRGLRAGPLAHATLAAAGGAVATVISAGPRAVVLRLEDGELVSLLPAAAPLHPWAVGVDVDLAALPAGACVTLGGGLLIDLSLRRHPPYPPGEATLRALATVAAMAEPAADDDADPFLAGFAAALADFADRQDVRPLADLVGLGPGLTPSGDDVLVGVLAGLDLLLAAQPEAAARRQALCALLDRERLARTSLLSAQMLRAACEGLYPEPLLELLEALGDRGGGSVQRAATGLAAVGHRSGRDMLRGLARTLAPPCRRDVGEGAAG